MDYQTLDPDTQAAPDNKEGLYYGIEVPPGSEDSGKPLCGPNQWPDAVRGPLSYRTVTDSGKAELLCGPNQWPDVVRSLRFTQTHRLSPGHGLDWRRLARWYVLRISSVLAAAHVCCHLLLARGCLAHPHRVDVFRIVSALYHLANG